MYMKTVPYILKLKTVQTYLTIIMTQRRHDLYMVSVTLVRAMAPNRLTQT
jgi:hypothetical protein